MTEEERQEALEHRDIILDVRAVLVTSSGQNLFKYLFKHFGITDLPELGLEGQILFEKLGFLRAGNSIFKLVAEANAETAATLLATTEKERYAKLYSDAQIGQS